MAALAAVAAVAGVLAGAVVIYAAGNAYHRRHSPTPAEVVRANPVLTLARAEAILAVRWPATLAVLWVLGWAVAAAVFWGVDWSAGAPPCSGC